MINRIYFITVLFFCNWFNINSQTYEFDKLIISNFSTTYHPNQKRINAFNTKDNSYFMYIQNWNDSLIGRVIDFKDYSRHSFFVDTVQSYQFKHLKSTVPSNGKALAQENVWSIRFKERSVKDEYAQMTCWIYDGNGKKKAKFKLEVQKSPEDCFFMFLYSRFDGGTFNFFDLNGLYPMTVKRSKGRFISQIGKSEYILEKMKDVQLILKVPQSNE